MSEWRKVALGQTASVRETLTLIEKSTTKIALIIDSGDRLLGTVTDGDIRRGLLRGVSVDAPVTEVMFRNFTTARAGENVMSMAKLMRSKGIRYLPVLDSDGRVTAIKIDWELGEYHERDDWVVLMVGGLGTRMLPLTSECPKPMLAVGDKPILEIILEHFVGFGFRNFFFAVNYMAEVIESYFGDGSRFGARISYLREDQKLGTAGALGLLPEVPKSTFLVMNGDLLTRVDFGGLLDFHREHKVSGTICVREHQSQVPFGVVSIEGHLIKTIEEKPIQRYFVNAGIYAFEPQVLDFVSRGDPLDMPELFKRMLARNMQIAAFPVFEYWRDIGRHKDYEQGQGEYPAVFDYAHEDLARGNR